MKFFSILVRYKETVVLFFVLLLLLIVGEGKIGIVDFVGIAGIIALWIVFILSKRKFVIPQGAVSAWWCAVLAYLICQILFSDSAGYTLFASLRFFSAYLVFVLFYNSHHSLRAYSYGVVLFAVISTLASFICTLDPALQRGIPDMNMLFARYGHGHLAYLLVFAVPFVIDMMRKRLSFWSGAAFLVVSAGLITTYARGAWLIIGLYMMYLLTQKASVRMRTVISCSLIVFGIIFFWASLSDQSRKVFIVGRPLPTKQDLFQARLFYWDQAMQSLKERPLFGSGLGTFYLQSLRYQKNPMSYSWFAHNFPLQTTAEVGIVGSILIIGLFIKIVRLIRKNIYHEAMRPLVESLFLSGIYSFYSLNFDYLIIWLLFWSSLGMLAGARLRTRTRQFFFSWEYVPVYLSIGLLVCVYSVTVVSQVADLFFKKNSPFVFLQPYNTEKSLEYLSALPHQPDAATLRTILWFNKRNPEVLIAAARAVRSDNAKEAVRLYKRASKEDPLNVRYFVDYIKLLSELNYKDELSQTLNSASQFQIDFKQHELLSFITPKLFSDIGTVDTKKEFMAKFYYLIGYAELDRDVELTRILWTLARDSAPEWGYFHVELANLYFSNFHNTGYAKKVLADCEKFQFAKKQCRGTVLSEDARPGNQATGIFSIPAIYKGP